MGYLFKGGKMMEYKIITGTGITVEFATSNLATKVEGYLDKGWHPQGGITMGQDPITKQMYATQAIVKEVE